MPLPAAKVEGWIRGHHILPLGLISSSHPPPPLMEANFNRLIGCGSFLWNDSQVIPAEIVGLLDTLSLPRSLVEIERRKLDQIMAYDKNSRITDNAL